MRHLKGLSLLAIAILLGLAAAVYAARWTAQRGGSVKLVVAATDIQLGTRITPQMLTRVEWPASAVPQGAFTDMAALHDRVLKVALLRGDAILERKLAPPGTTGGLSAVIAEGKRAMTVRVNDVVGVAGFALPGNYVDVVVNMPRDATGGRGKDPISRTVLEQVLVLAVAQEASRDDLKPKVVSAVTLELSPNDAEKLDLARSVGTLSLVLRNQLDKAAVATSGITRDELLGVKHVAARATEAPVKRVVLRRSPEPEHAPPRECVQVFRGGSSVTHCF